MNDNNISHENAKIKINQQESKLVLCLFSHLRNIYCTIGLDGGGFLGPLDMDQGSLLICSASLRAIIFDDDVPEPPLFSLIKKLSPNPLFPCIESNVNMFFMSDFFGERPHVSDLMIKVLYETFVVKNQDLKKIDEDDAFLIAYLSGRGFEDLFSQSKKWLPTSKELPGGGVGISGTSEGLAPSQVVEFKRRNLPFEEWRNSRIGYLKNIPIKRKDIIRWTANKLGGVHYDSKRLPPKKDRETFHLLSEAYDWNDEAIVHAGLVCTAIIAMELMLCPEVMGLFKIMPEFLSKRDRRLRRRMEDCEQDWL